MALSKEWEEWHLTPRGWIKGTEKTDFRRIDAPTPEDTVATFKFNDVLPSAFSEPDVTWKLIWKAEGEDVEPLLNEFGPYPSELAGIMERFG